MSAEFHDPVSRACRPDETAQMLSRSSDSQAWGKEEYASLVETFYDLITDFYEFG